MDVAVWPDGAKRTGFVVRITSMSGLDRGRGKHKPTRRPIEQATSQPGLHVMITKLPHKPPQQPSHDIQRAKLIVDAPRPEHRQSAPQQLPAPATEARIAEWFGRVIMRPDGSTLA